MRARAREKLEEEEKGKEKFVRQNKENVHTHEIDVGQKRRGG